MVCVCVCIANFIIEKLSCNMLDSNYRGSVSPSIDRTPADINGNANSRPGRLLLGYLLYIYHFFHLQ